MMQTPAHLIEAHGHGRRLAGVSMYDIVWGDLAPAWIFEDADAAAFFEIGHAGNPLPEYRTGWRFGDIPAGGHSTNYRDNYQEAGVSVMQIGGEEQTATMFTKFNTGRPVVRVGGWLHPMRCGGDGEALLLAAHRIE